DGSMRTGSTADLGFARSSGWLRRFTRRLVSRLCGLSLIAISIFAIASLATWNVADPSLSHATGNIVTNAMGYAGAIFADLIMQFLGLAAVPAVLPSMSWGLLIFWRRGVDRKRRRAAAWLGCCILAAAAASCMPPPPSWPLPTGLGGVIGDVALKLPQALFGPVDGGLVSMLPAIALLVPSVWLFFLAAGLLGRAALATEPDEPAEEDAEEEPESRLQRFA